MSQKNFSGDETSVIGAPRSHFVMTLLLVIFTLAYTALMICNVVEGDLHGISLGQGIVTGVVFFGAVFVASSMNQKYFADHPKFDTFMKIAAGVVFAIGIGVGIRVGLHAHAGKPPRHMNATEFKWSCTLQGFFAFFVFPALSVILLEIPERAKETRRTRSLEAELSKYQKTTETEHECPQRNHPPSHNVLSVKSLLSFLFVFEIIAHIGNRSALRQISKHLQQSQKSRK